jgi:hypothetical protein
VISRHHGGSTSASMVTYPCSTRSSLRSGPLMPMKMRTTVQPWAWASLNTPSLAPTGSENTVPVMKLRW